METKKAAELVLVIFARMNRAERVALIKLLKHTRITLDVNYPEGFQGKEV